MITITITITIYSDNNNNNNNNIVVDKRVMRSLESLWQTINVKETSIISGRNQRIGSHNNNNNNNSHQTKFSSNRADSVTWNPHKLLGTLLQCSTLHLKEEVRFDLNLFGDGDDGRNDDDGGSVGGDQQDPSGPLW